MNDNNGKDRKHAGADAVLESAPDWKEEAIGAIDKMASTRRQFTSEDVRLHVSDPPHPNAMGAAFMRASRLGMIRRVGYSQAKRASAHGRPIAVWERGER